MEPLRLLVTVLAALCGLLAVGWTIEAKRREEDAGAEARRARDDAAELEARARAIEGLAGQLSAAMHATRRLRALEAVWEMLGW